MSTGLAQRTAHRERPHVVIIGAGFAGLNAAKGLRHADVRVTVIDRRNHHLFQPLLYQVATAGLNASDIAAPVRRVLRHQKNAEVLLAEAEGVDLEHKCVLLDRGRLPYDHLIIATGSSHSYFGHPEWAERAPGLKSIEDALEIRRRVLLAYELAEQEADPRSLERLLTFVVVGGGPTGVELAGAIAEISRHALAQDFRHIDPRRARVVLVEAGPRVLAAYPPELSASAARQLEHLGVEVHCGDAVTQVDAMGVNVNSGRIEAHTVLWAAGVAASPLTAATDAPRDRQGRVKVTPYLTLPDHDDVYVIGDAAAVEQPDGSTVPGLAPAAMQQGTYVAKRIRGQLRGAQVAPFHYFDKGMLATIGRRSAVADIRNLKFSGTLAWFIWLVVHIMFLVGFRNRVLVFLEWFWSYVTFERGARLITGSTRNERRLAVLQQLPPPQARALDPVDEASMESFPASDPPGWIGATADARSR